MTLRPFASLAVLTLCCSLSSGCGTVHAVRWSYGESSVFDDPSRRAAHYVRPICAAPLIVGCVGFDAVTWPLQLIFGVWPWWGQDSELMRPGDVD